MALQDRKVFRAFVNTFAKDLSGNENKKPIKEVGAFL